ncbi:MAG: YdcF family protein [Coriobacteriia bacterium]|nr:YdcF family protein [Coriobacteriia bacterium]
MEGQQKTSPTVRKGTDKRGSLIVSFVRGMAFFMGTYSLISLYAVLRGGYYNANMWWIDLTDIPQALGLTIQLCVSIALIAFFIRVPTKLVWRTAGAALCVVFALFALHNALSVYEVVRLGYVKLGFSPPFSVFVMLAFIVFTVAVFFSYRSLPDPSDSPEAKARKPFKARFLSFCTITLAVILCGIAFPLGQFVCFGMTEYQGSVDAVVVLGARVYPSGTLSPALAGRVDKAIELYHLGYTPVLIMSGGNAGDGMNEALAMRLYAIDHGVPSDAIIVDTEGSNTENTVINTIRIAEEHGFKTIGAVSSFYHMPRIKMFFLSYGMDVLTYPADGTKEGASTVRTAMREIPGWWFYWFKMALFHN